MCRADAAPDEEPPVLWMGGSSVDILSLADSPLATAAAAPLLLALSRSSAAAELLTGKGELHWRREVKRAGGWTRDVERHVRAGVQASGEVNVGSSTSSEETP